MDIAYATTEDKPFRTFITACSPLKRKRLDTSIKKSPLKRDLNAYAGMQMISVLFWVFLVLEDGNDSIHDHPSYLCCPDALSLVGDPLSGNGCGSPNHI